MPQVKRQTEDKFAAVGVGKYLGKWDLSHPDTQQMMKALEERDMVKLGAAMEDHWFRPSMKLASRSLREKKEYVGFKVC